MGSSFDVVAVAGAQRLAAAGTTRGNRFWMQGMQEIFRDADGPHGAATPVFIKKKDCSSKVF
jgi:hypothetical protein